MTIDKEYEDGLRLDDFNVPVNDHKQIARKGTVVRQMLPDASSRLIQIIYVFNRLCDVKTYAIIYFSSGTDTESKAEEINPKTLLVSNPMVVKSCNNSAGCHYRIKAPGFKKSGYHPSIRLH